MTPAERALLLALADLAAATPGYAPLADMQRLRERVRDARAGVVQELAKAAG
jgi:hypothetical protein